MLRSHFMVKRLIMRFIKGLLTPSTVSGELTMLASGSHHGGWSVDGTLHPGKESIPSPQGSDRGIVLQEKKA